MNYRFYTLDVFTDKHFTGNPLAVFPAAEGLSNQIMQKIATEFNFSETVFVFPSSNPKADKKVRIFTPTEEIPFAGHPTIGTSFLLTKIGIFSSTKEEFEVILEEGVGNISVTIKCFNGDPFYTELEVLSTPQFNNNFIALQDLAEMLSLSIQDLIVGDYEIKGVSCGLPFLFLPIKTINALSKAKVNLTIWQNLRPNLASPHLYLFCNITENKWRSRMFAPALGITEDPATGSAAAAFGAYLGQKEANLNGHWKWTIEQGIEMGRASLLQISVTKENSLIKSIKVGGSSVLISEGNLLIER